MLILRIGLVLAAVLLTAGCEDDPEIRFTSSPAGPADDRVRLTGGPIGGNDVAVNVVIGPTSDRDIKGFSFGLAIANPGLADFVPGSATAGNALELSSGCSSIQVLTTPVTGGLSVAVNKLGPCAGNGMDGEETILSMTFRVFAEGSTTVTLADTLVDDGGNPPTALDSSAAAVPTVTFDLEDAVISKM